MSLEYAFTYSAIAYGSILPTIAYGGYYGADTGDTTGIVSESNATQGSDPHTELTDQIIPFKDAVIELLSATTATPYDGGDTTFSPYPSWYTIVSSSSGTVTFDTQDASSIFYVYNTGDMNLENIKFIKNNNAQSYNIYFISSGAIYLKGKNYGNFIGTTVIAVNDNAYVRGSVSATDGDLGGDSGGTVQRILTVRLGSPTYTFSYSAISNHVLDNIDVYGGNVGVGTDGAITIRVNLHKGATITSDSASNSELNKLISFKTEVYDFLSTNTLYTMTDITADTTIKPISKNKWYKISNISNATTITFDPDTIDDVFYIVTNGGDMELNTVRFIVNELTNPGNIYVICFNNMYLSRYDMYGNFLCNTYVYSSYITTINGTVAACNDSDSYLCYALGTAGLTINFVTECFMEGTKILTDQWYVPIEELKVGGMVLTYGEIQDNKYCSTYAPIPQPIVSIRKQVRTASRATSPIVFCKNTFTPNKPFEKLYVSPKHGMITRKGYKCRADRFINDSTIYQDPTIDTITYYHIELATHCAIMANGVLTETWRDSKKT